MTQSQNAQIHQYLNQGKTLTSLEALRLFGCLRLSARIYDIRDKGFKIKVRTITTLTNKHIAQYYI